MVQWAALGLLAALAFVTLPARGAVTEAWVKRSNAPANGGDYAQAVAVDGSGNVVVTGYSVGSGSGWDYYTAKYAAADGSLLWEKRYNSPANGEDYAFTMAVDGSGNVVVTGFSGFWFSGFDNYYNYYNYYTAKYAAADGALLWEQRYIGPANGDDRALALAVDGSGNVVVTGYSATIKYRADGTGVWTNNDVATALALDSSGNVAVTGYSGNYPNFDYHTAKYAAADGALLWEQRYDGPANDYDFPRAVAVDGCGNIVVTGESVGTGGYADYYTAKYTAADGALLWEQRYNGPANWFDRVGYGRCLALGPNGMVAVTGYSINSSGNSEYATVVYRETFPPVITCPSNAISIATSATGAIVHFTVTATDHCGVALTCAPPSGSVFPIGQTTVTCTATDGDALTNACTFTVTVRGARGVKASVLAGLIGLRATVTDRDEGRALDEAIAHLTQSLAAEFWVDETHLERRHGGKVFHEEKEAIRSLCDLIQSRKSHLPDAVLQGFVDQLIRADRLLASVAIEEAITAGMSGKKIEQAQKFLARGDAEAADGKCANGIEEYRKAWKRAARAKVSPPVRLANGRVRLEIAGEPGERFAIQCSANLKDWLTLGTRTANAEGVVTFEDSEAGPHPTRFYRVVGE